MSRYVTQVRVRWSDLDAFGHVNNARTVTLLEEARVDWLFTDAARHGVDRLTEGIVVAHLDIDYRRPIGMKVPVTVSMGLTKVGTASFTVDYVLSQAGATAATASTVLVPVDPTTFRPRRLDDRERGYLDRFLAPATPPAARSGAGTGAGTGAGSAATAGPAPDGAAARRG